MKSKVLLFFLLFFFIKIFFYCSTSTGPNDQIENPAIDTSLGFLPMQIGNYWKNNKDNFFEIIDTITINNEKYYEFFSRVGGDAVGYYYYRIDENQNLIQSSPRHPEYTRVRAKFNAAVGDTFYTDNFKIKVTYKTKNLICFLNTYNGSKFGYWKGIGFAWDRKEIKINGRIYQNIYSELLWFH